MGQETEKRCDVSYKLVVALLLSIFCVGFITQYYYTTKNRSSPVPTCVSTDQKESSSNSSIITLDINYVEENLISLDQKDPQLIQYARVRHLTPPSKLPYNLNNNTFRDTFSGWVADFFGNKQGGKFIEAGANKGEHASHSLYLEKELGWTGLLVECNPKVVPFLRTKHRKAWIGDVCLSPTRNPGTLNLSNPTNWTYSGTLGKPWNLPVKSEWESFHVQSMPLYTILAALGWKEVDYFSFDIEGQELRVLRNFPFDLFTFNVLILENYFNTKDELAELDNLLQSNGYIFVKAIQVDRVYVHEKYKSMFPKN